MNYACKVFSRIKHLEIAGIVIIIIIILLIHIKYLLLENFWYQYICKKFIFFYLKNFYSFFNI